MRRYRLRALVKFDPAARGDRAPDFPSRTGTLTIHPCCLLQPLSHRGYFPAVITRDENPALLQSSEYAVVTIALADGEAEAYFAPGQGFTIWADGMVDNTIRAEGMIGYGVICSPESALVTFGEGGRRGGQPVRRSAALIRR